MNDVTFTPIGVIRSDHLRPDRTPIQPVYARGCAGRVEVDPRYAEGLRDIEGFSHLYLIYSFDRADAPTLVVKPFLQDVEHGVFATRSPRRPNAIGISIVRLLRREDNVLHVEDLDILDGTPLLDIKPYSARFDHVVSARNGWQDQVDEKTARTRGLRSYSVPGGPGESAS